MPTEKTTQLALLAETQAHMEKILKMLLMGQESYSETPDARKNNLFFVILEFIY